jgi:hypothetical protein
MVAPLAAYCSGRPRARCYGEVGLGFTFAIPPAAGGAVAATGGAGAALAVGSTVSAK